MVDGFIRKKVETLTLGEKLKKPRSQYRMSLAEISKATKIQVKYLEFLENGEYEKLPAEVYTRGFLKSYARYLGMDETSLVKLYEKERGIQAQLGKDIVHEVRPHIPLTSSLVLSSRVFMVAGIVVLLLGTFGYLFYEFRSFVAEPSLVVFEPADGAEIKGSSVVLRGRTDRGAQVTLNGQAVLVGNDGGFQETLSLQPGLNTVEISSLNRFQKEKEVRISFQAAFETMATAEAEAAKEKFLLRVSTKNKGAKLIITADGRVAYSGLLPAGESQEVSASSEVSLSTDNGADTLVSFKGGEAKPLSEEATPLEGAVFTSAGRRE